MTANVLPFPALFLLSMEGDSLRCIILYSSYNTSSYNHTNQEFDKLTFFYEGGDFSFFFLMMASIYSQSV